MSEIDLYKHECIGIAVCPSTYEIVSGNNNHRNIPLYCLGENALESRSLQGKMNDLLLGGGEGESAAFRVSIPETIYFLTHEGWDKFTTRNEVFKAYWSMNDAYIFGEGYAKLGWLPNESIEIWLAKHIIAFILREYPEVYGQFNGDLQLDKDGSIFRRPTAEEKQIW